MICKNCGSYYVRDPCPSCNTDNSKMQGSEGGSVVSPSQVRERELKETASGNQVLVQKEKEERLVRPSQRLKEQTKPEEEEERLVKPSERFKSNLEDNEDLPSFKRFEQSQSGQAKVIKPRDQKKETKDDIPSFKRFERSEETQTKEKGIGKKEKEEKNQDDIPSFMRFDQDADPNVSKISDNFNTPEHKNKLKNDKEYRSKVKETLEEVMGLLEKLIDEE